MFYTRRRERDDIIHNEFCKKKNWYRLISHRLVRGFRCQQKIKANVFQVPDGRAGDGFPDFQVHRAEQETADVVRAEPH